MEFFKPEYAPTHYSWAFNGTTYIRKIDGSATRSMYLTPNSKYLLVMQLAEKFGSDNILILSADGSEYKRLANPYLTSPEYQAGDHCEFDDIQIEGWEGRIRILIYVSRILPGNTYKAEPHYGTFYDDENWMHTPLEFVTSKAL